MKVKIYFFGPLLISLYIILASGCTMLRYDSASLPEETKREVYQEVAAKIQSCLDKGDMWYEKGEYFRALVNYRAASFFDTDSAWLQKRIEELNDLIVSESAKYYQKGLRLLPDDKEKALIAFNLALHSNPENYNAEKMRVSLFKDRAIRNRVKELENEVWEAISSYTASVEEILSLDKKIGRLLSFDIANKTALSAKERIDVDRNKYVGDLLSKARNLQAAGELDQAGDLYREARALSPDNPAIRKRLKDIQQQKDVNYFLSLAEYRFGRHDYRNAMEFADKALCIDPKNEDARHIISESLLMLQKVTLEEAKQFFAKRDYANALAALRELLDNSGKNGEAVSLASIVKENLGKEMSQMLAEGRSLYEKKKFSKALILFRYVQEVDPQNNIASTFIKKIHNRLKTIESLR